MTRKLANMSRTAGYIGAAVAAALREHREVAGDRERYNVFFVETRRRCPAVNALVGWRIQLLRGYDLDR